MLFARNKKNPITIADKKVEKWTYSTCGYCSTGCSIEIGTNQEGTPVSSRGVGGADVNQGKLCLKGIFEHELFESSGRGKTPLIRGTFMSLGRILTGIRLLPKWRLKSNVSSPLMVAMLLPSYQLDKSSPKGFIP